MHTPLLSHRSNISGTQCNSPNWLLTYWLGIGLSSSKAITDPIIASSTLLPWLVSRRQVAVVLVAAKPGQDPSHNVH
jgi:hypothetical protein